MSVRWILDIFVFEVGKQIVVSSPSVRLNMKAKIHVNISCTIGFLFISKTNIRVSNKESGFFSQCVIIAPAAYDTSGKNIAFHTAFHSCRYGVYHEILLARNLLFETRIVSESVCGRREYETVWQMFGLHYGVVQPWWFGQIKYFATIF